MSHRPVLSPVSVRPRAILFGRRLGIFVVAALLGGCQSGSAQGNDPPARVGRISDVTGSVSFLPVGSTDWSAASLNYPLTTGDALWADADARAEIHIGASAIGIAPGTSLALDAIEDNLIQVRIGQGAIRVRLRELDPTDSYEIDTPSGAILLRATGDYRVDVTPDGQRAIVTVRSGDADVMLGDQTYRVPTGTSLTLVGGNAQPIASSQMMAVDGWENWARSRDPREDAAISTQYVSRDMVGYEDLDQYGDWQVDATYGPVWYPRSVRSDWAPYRSGHWESVQPWGWTWIDDNPWGFAPFHYGRWSHDRGRWGWIPGNERSRPVYAPALVAFVSAGSWSASVSFGSGGGVGWVPLGPHEVYVPGYRTSAGYVRNVNSANVDVSRVDVNRVNVATVQYANRNVTGAVTAVPRDAFVRSRPVASAAVPVRQADLAAVHVSAAPIAAGVAIAPPPRGSARPQPANAAPVRRPPVELPRAAAPPVGNRGRGNQARPVAPPPVNPTQPPAPPAGNRGRGNPPPPAAPPQVIRPAPPQPQPPPTQRGRGNPPTPPPAIPTKPPTQRGRGNPPPPPAAIPTPPPTQRGRGNPPPPPPAIPTKPPTQRGRGNPPPPPSAIPTPPPTQRGRGNPPPPPPAIPTKPPTQRGRGNPPPPPSAIPTKPPTQRGRGVPPPAPARGRGQPARPDTSHPVKPPKGKPDSGGGGGGLLLASDYLG